MALLLGIIREIGALLPRAIRLPDMRLTALGRQGGRAQGESCNFTLEDQAMRILLAYDGSEGAETASDLVAHLPLPSETKLAVVAVIDTPAPALSAVDVPVRSLEDADRELELRRSFEHQLPTVAAKLGAPDRSCETRILRGRPATELVKEAERWSADLIVVGSRSLGRLGSLLLGSTSAEVVDHAPCPVLVARHPGVHRLVIGVDGSPTADRAIATLCALPWRGAVPAVVVGVVEPISAWDFAGGGFTPELVEMGIEAQEERGRQLKTKVDGAVASLRRAGGRASGEVRKGDAADQLIAAAEGRGADLVVVGTRGLDMLKRLLRGSVARKVLLNATASVLVIRPLREKTDTKQPVAARAAL
jgi:nucleotide-binding universal stress UspA family protein